MTVPSQQNKEGEIMEENTLHIFTVSGHTFTFRSVVIQTDNETHLAFDYTAQSDGKKKRAVFLKANMAGWSITI